ncbi:MAG: TIGR03619 family F420-dependent LLM class oxidoreductase [Acidimicrobiia bacterium]
MGTITFGVGVVPYYHWPSLDALVEFAQVADRLGLDSISLPDHIAVPDTPVRPRSGDVWHDIFTLGTLIAAHTTNLGIRFNALVVPMRPALPQARQIASLDLVSKGRLSIVAGAGWMEPEFVALGIPFAERGAITDEYLRAMKALWVEEKASFHGRYVSFDDVIFEPKCVQRPHVPIWVGGTGAAPFRRVVELGDGWAPMTGTFDERARDVVMLKRRAEEAGRDPGTLGFAGGLRVGETNEVAQRMMRGHHATERDIADANRRAAFSADAALEEIERSAAAGFTHLEVSIAWDTPQDYAEKLTWFAENVLARVQR